MPKKIDDIVPPKRPSIRDVPIPEGRKRSINILKPDDIRPRAPQSAAAPMPVEEELPMMPVLPPTPVVEHNPLPPYRDYVPPRIKRRSSGRIWWLAGIILILAGVFVVFNFMSGATLAYTPKTATLSFAHSSLTAYKNADSSSGKLAFSVIQISQDKSTAVAASGQSNVSEKASGTIVVYNNASTDAQKLVKNTRFQTTDGKIYRVASDISIPGKTTGSDGSVVPGSLEITVTADQPGADYNIPLSDFTIPGLKGDPRYSTIYARSKTPMTGGFVGVRAVASAADTASAKSKLDADLKTALVAAAKAQVPADYVLFDNLSQVSYQSLPASSTTDTTVSVHEQGNFSGVMFKKTDLAGYLAAQKLGNDASGTLTLADTSGLNATFAASTSPSLTADQVSFVLDGSASAEWVTDAAALSSSLANKSKSDLDTVLKSFPSINSATATIKPFWKTSFPSDPTKIKIVKNG